MTPILAASLASIVSLAIGCVVGWFACSWWRVKYAADAVIAASQSDVARAQDEATKQRDAVNSQAQLVLQGIGTTAPLDTLKQLVELSGEPPSVVGGATDPATAVGATSVTAQTPKASQR